MVSRERIQVVLDRIRPYIQADGGDVELVDVVDRQAKIRLSGKCVGCPSAHLTFFLGLESAIRDEVPEFDSLILV